MDPTDSGEILGRVLARLDAMEARLNLLEGASRPSAPERPRIPEPFAEPVAPWPTTERERRPAAPTPVEPTPQPIEPDEIPAASSVQPEPDPQFETQVGLTWLNRIGVITVVLGVAFFFKYAVDNRLIGELGRVILGVVVAFAALGFAEVMQRRGHRIYAQGITGAGIAILYLSLYASFGFYHLIPQFAAFVLMFMATTLAVLLALRYDSIAIAFLGFIGGYLTPLLLGVTDSAPWKLYGYLLILQAGCVALARRTNWTYVVFLGFAGSYLTPLLLGINPGHPWTLFAYLLIIQIAGIVLTRRPDWRYLEPLVLAGTALLYLIGQMADRPIAGTASALTFYALFWICSPAPIVIVSQILAVMAIAAIWPGPQTQSLWINLLLAAAGLQAVRRHSVPAFSLLALFLFWISAVYWTSRSDSAFLLGMIALTAGFLIFLLYAVREVTSQPISAEGSPKQDTAGPSLAILATNGLSYFGLCYVLLRSDYHDLLGAFAAFLAAVHLFVAWQMWQEIEPNSEARADFSSPQYRPILLLLGIALSLVTIAIPIQFSEYRVTMAWAIEGAAFTWIAARTGNRRFGTTALVIFGLAFLRLYIFDGRMYLTSPSPGLLLNARFATLVISGVCFWLGAKWMEKGTPALVVYVAGHFVVLWALMAETLDWAGQRTSMGNSASLGTISASVLMALYGLTLVIVGVSTRSLINRILGLGLLAIVILKLYLYDVWQLEQTFRIVAFVVLGVLLLGASFLYSRFRPMVEKLLDSKKDEIL